METYLLGIDVGTTGTKTLLIRADGAKFWHASMTYPLNTPKPGYSEQDANAWWDALIYTVQSVMQQSNLSPKSVVALSLSLQGGTMVPLDAGYHPLRPAIVWNDKRSIKQCDAFAQRFGAQAMYAKSGWLLGPGQMAMSIAWLAENEPDVFAKTAYFSSVPDFISVHLTGKLAVDISDAGINQLADICTGKYDVQILDFCGIRPEQLGEIFPSGKKIGGLTAEAARQLHLLEGTPVISGTHDQFAGAIGAGLFEEGDILLGTGTTWGAVALSNTTNFHHGFMQAVSPAPGKWGNYVSIYTGGICLEWLRTKLFGNDGQPASFDLLNKLAQASPPGSNGLIFYPYFCGSGFPQVDSSSKATFVGLDLSHGQSDITRAIMEGVAFQSAWALESYANAFGIRKLKMSGGAIKSPLWQSIVAAINDRPLSIPLFPDLTCIGAAILAGVGSGIYRNVEDGYTRLKIPEKIVSPDPALHIYRELFQRYKSLAVQVRTLYQAQTIF